MVIRALCKTSLPPYCLLGLSLAPSARTSCPFRASSILMPALPVWPLWPLPPASSQAVPRVDVRFSPWPSLASLGASRVACADRWSAVDCWAAGSGSSG